MTKYSLFFTSYFEKQLKKLKKKDPVLCLRLQKKLLEIQSSPQHYKPLKNVLKGKRRVHLDPFIIIFEIQEDLIVVHYVKHHDDAY